MQRLFLLLFVMTITGLSAQVKNISITEVPEKLLERGVLVDVRTPVEFEEGHLPGALNIDVKSEEFINEVSGIRKNRNVLLYCRSGRRSARAAEILDSLGYKKVYNLEGGYLAWDAAKNEQ
ncbi:rhodanese-like domain-containing protein [Robertkochia flava]|uniref:rhodanese-like domain-containing protein n=1 Tax=Robertkochia flava TaxID=3447986 RepID=UPI001CCF3661|nr:rhodanese-like domain-containing protein [Robertkochia marina]